MANEEKMTRVPIMLGAIKGKLIRFSYFHVFEPHMGYAVKKADAKMEYAVTALIPKGNTEDIALVKAAIQKIKQTDWLDKGLPVPAKWRSPLRDGDTDVKEESGEPMGAECKGHMVLRFKSNVDLVPSVIGTTRGEDGKFIRLAKGAARSGDWGRISGNLTGYRPNGGGVGAYLSTVQLVQKGEPLAGGSDPEREFAAFMEDDDADEDAMFR